MFRFIHSQQIREMCTMRQILGGIQRSLPKDMTVPWRRKTQLIVCVIFTGENSGTCMLFIGIVEKKQRQDT